MKKHLSLLCISLAACSSAPVVTPDYQAYLEKMAERKPLFEMTCPVQGCVMVSLKVYEPSGNQQVAPPPVHESDGWKIWREIRGTAIGVASIWVPWHYGAQVLGKAFDASTQPVTTNTTVTASGAGAGAASGGTASGSFSQPTTTNTVTTTTTTNTANSNNDNSNQGNTLVPAPVPAP